MLKVLIFLLTMMIIVLPASSSVSAASCPKPTSLEKTCGVTSAQQIFPSLCSLSANDFSRHDRDDAQGTGPDQFKSCPKAVIIALNKVTAKSQELTLRVGEPQYFGNIEIKIHQCLKALDPYQPDNQILLTVSENNLDQDATVIFQGWLISSSISASTLEHPVYEIFAKDCLEN